MRWALALFVLAAACVDDGIEARKRVKRAERKAKEQAAKRAEEAAIIDEDYRFRIDDPGGEWKLLRAEELGKLSADAVAGGTSAMWEIFAFVIVQPALDDDLSTIARSFDENLGFRGRGTFDLAEVTFCGESAVRYQRTGELDGDDTTVRNTLFNHGGFLYQVMTLGPANMGHHHEFRRFEEAFSLLPGKVRPRRVDRTRADTYGVGWQLRGGVFESVVSGLRVEPRDGWNVIVGRELAELDVDAEFGLVRNEPDVYAVVLFERAQDADEYRRLRFADMPGLTDLEKPFTATVAGKPFRFRRHSSGDDGRHAIAVEKVGGLMIEVSVWHVEGAEVDLVGPTRSLGESVKVLPTERRETLARELAARPDPDEAVGDGFALRAGLYRDFAQQLLWRKPTGLWMAFAGSEASSRDADARLWIREPRLEIRGLLSVYRSEQDAAKHHAACVAEQLGENQGRAPTPLRLGEVRALRTDSEVDRYHMVICTLARGDKRLKWVFWTRTELWEKARTGVEQAIRGLSFAEKPLVPMTHAPNGEVQDHRFGFRYRPPGSGWTFAKAPSPEIEGMTAAGYRWMNEKRLIEVGAASVMDDARAITWLFEFMQQSYEDRVVAKLGVKTQRREVEFAGLRWRHIHWKHRRGSADLFLARKQRTIYGILTVAPPGASISSWLVRKGFAFLD